MSTRHVEASNSGISWVGSLQILRCRAAASRREVRDGAALGGQRGQCSRHTNDLSLGAGGRRHAVCRSNGRKVWRLLNGLYTAAALARAQLAWCAVWTPCCRAAGTSRRRILCAAAAVAGGRLHWNTSCPATGRRCGECGAGCIDCRGTVRRLLGAGRGLPKGAVMCLRLGRFHVEAG